MHNRSAAYHISSSEDSCARTSVHRREVLLHPGLLILPGPLSLRTVLQTVWTPPCYPFHLQAVQTAVHTFFLHWHRLHQRPGQYEQLPVPSVRVTYSSHSHVECLLTLFCSLICRTGKQWLVFFAFQSCSFICLKNLVCRLFLLLPVLPRTVSSSALCHIINSSVCCFYLCIILLRIYAECKIRWKCPWCCCPCKNIRILIFDLKSDDRRSLLDILISLCNFLCRKRCSTTRAVRNNLESLVKESFIPNLSSTPTTQTR